MDITIFSTLPPVKVIVDLPENNFEPPDNISSIPIVPFFSAIAGGSSLRVLKHSLNRVLMDENFFPIPPTPK